MAVTLNANTSTGFIATSDTSGVLQLQTAGTTAVSIDASQVVALTNGATIQGLTVGRGGGAVASNTAVGASALAANTSGANNVAIGTNTLDANTSGISNTGVGANSLDANTTGGSNSALGYLSLFANTTGTNNSAIGRSALEQNTTGGTNTALGADALKANTTASNNTAVGYQAGYSNTTGTFNTLIGVSAGTNITTGQQHIVIGHNSQTSSATVNSEFVLGINAVGKGTTTGFISVGGGVYQGNNSASWSTTSDRRLKKNIVDNNTGLEKITAIRVRNFEYRLPDEVDAELKPTDAIQKSGVQLGVIAQELNEVLPECIKTESTGVMSVNPDNLTWYLVNAIQELKAEVDSLKYQINGA